MTLGKGRSTSLMVLSITLVIQSPIFSTPLCVVAILLSP